MGAREKHFIIDGALFSEKDIMEHLKSLGYSYSPSNRMVYDPEKVPDDWPVRGFLVNNLDISFEPPEFDRILQRLIGRVDLEAEYSSKNYKASLILFKKLKNKFELKD